MVVKRVFDIFFSIVVIILFSPVILVVSAIIKFHDSGSIFYRAPRVGKNGIIFKMFKFRTMVVDADKIGPSSTSNSDSRITPIGRILRRYKLDELPQMFNVLKGEMSVVGPRPEVKKFTDMFNEEELAILSVKPGITDWASIWNSNEGEILDGADDPDKAYMELIRPEKIRLQLKYVRNISVWTDFKIIFITFRKVLFGN